MIEIRLHARAGHGMVTGADIVAQAANYENKFSQAFPFFGSEKRGPPVEAYVRIDDKPITIHEEIAEPDIVVVADPSIMPEVDVCAGLKENGIVIINTTKKAEDLNIKANRVFTVDASSVALKHFKKLILNTLMLGALCKATGVVKIDSVKRAIREVLGKKLPQQVVDANINAIQELYDSMKVNEEAVKA